MITLLFASMTLGWVAPVARPKKNDQFPKEDAPTIVTVARVELSSGTIIIARSRLVAQTRARTVTRIINGQQITQTVTEVVHVPVIEQYTMRYPEAAHVRHDGKQLEMNVKTAELLKGRTIVLTSNPKGLSPVYRKMFAKDVVILVMPK